MKKQINHQKQAARERVQRCRAKQAANARTRVELCLDQPTLDAVMRYAENVDGSRASALRSLVITGLRVEWRLPVPEWFSDRMRKRFR